LVGGSYKPRTGSKSIRWRLHNAPGMKNLLNLINGYLRNSIRMAQFDKACTILNIKPITAKPFTRTNALLSSWFAGFFDSDGYIGFSIKNGTSQ
jgi:hypothetical protein